MAKAPRQGRSGGQDAAVTPVIGTVMILGITVLGIGAIMFWGAPTLQAIQDRNALTAMEGEFLEIRTGTLDLTIDKASRLPEVVLESGELRIEPGTRFMVTDNSYGDPLPDPSCDLHITGWDDATPTTLRVEAGADCANGGLSDCDAPTTTYCLHVQRVTGSSATTVATVEPYAGAGPWDVTLVGTTADTDLDDGDWVFRIQTGGDTVAQAWVLSTNRIVYELQTGSSDVGVVVEAGAVFERNGPQYYLLRAPAIQEAASQPGDFVLRLPTYVGSEYGAVSGRSNVQVFIGQVGNNHLRISSDATHLVRFDFAGDMAEAWCRSVLLRNNLGPDGVYGEDPASPCTSTVPSVTYTPDAAIAPINFELFHARVTARLQT